MAEWLSGWVSELSGWVAEWLRSEWLSDGVAERLVSDNQRETNSKRQRSATGKRQQ